MYMTYYCTCNKWRRMKSQTNKQAAAENVKLSQVGPAGPPQKTKHNIIVAKFPVLLIMRVVRSRLASLHPSSCLPFSSPSLPHPPFLPSLPPLPPGMIYAIGGSDGSNLNTAECYNTATKTWSPIAPMHTCRKFPGVEALGGAVYAIGGRDATMRHNSVERWVINTMCIYVCRCL